MAVFSEEVRCCLIRRISKINFQVKKDGGCITSSCELGRKIRLRHIHLRRQTVGYPRVLEPAIRIAYRLTIIAT